MSDAGTRLPNKGDVQKWKVEVELTKHFVSSTAVLLADRNKQRNTVLDNETNSGTGAYPRFFEQNLVCSGCQHIPSAVEM